MHEKYFKERLTFYLKRDIMPNFWIITGPKGNVISGPKRFDYPHKAEEWARVFVSSWIGPELVVEK